MAVYVMLVAPSGNALPLLGPSVRLMEAPPQLSVTVGAVHVAGAVQFAPAFNTIVVGELRITGGS